MSYFYPDKSDFVTLSLVCKKDVDDKILNDVEDDLFSSAKAMFQNNRFDSLLDLGCGEGRLSIKFSEYFKKVTGLEPDKSRLDAAKRNIAENNIKNVEFKNSLFQEACFPDNHFDAIICNQVLQHVETNTAKTIINEAYRVLKNNGIFVLSVSGTERNKEYYKKAFLENDVAHSLEVTREVFDDLISNEKSILPIRYFAEETITNYLSQFRLIEQSTFTEVYPEPTLLFIVKKQEE